MGDNVLASYTSGLISIDTWDPITSLMAGSNSSLSGQLTIKLEHISGYETDWDNIRLNKQPGVAAPQAVPEPGSIAMMGLGLASLGFAVRRRKKVSYVRGNPS